MFMYSATVRSPGTRRGTNPDVFLFRNGGLDEKHRYRVCVSGGALQHSLLSHTLFPDTVIKGVPYIHAAAPRATAAC